MRCRPPWSAAASCKVIEVALGLDAASHTENVCRHRVRVEGDVVARAMPEIVRIAEEIVHLIRCVGIEPELRQRHLDPSGLDVMRVEIHGDEYEVAQIRCGLRVKQQMLV